MTFVYHLSINFLKLYIDDFQSLKIHDHLVNLVNIVTLQCTASNRDGFVIIFGKYLILYIFKVKETIPNRANFVDENQKLNHRERIKETYVAN